MSICTQVLVETDVRATARLVLLDFPLDLAEVAYKLQANPAEQFNFLQGIFDPKFVLYLKQSTQVLILCVRDILGLRRSRR